MSGKSIDVELTITGIQEALDRNTRRIANLQASGVKGAAIRDATADLHRYAVSITHVQTGALRASHRMEVTPDRGRIYIDPSSINPRTGERPAVYGVEEEERGGTHAFYRRTRDERGPYAVGRAIEQIKRGLYL